MNAPTKRRQLHSYSGHFHFHTWYFYVLNCVSCFQAGASILLLIIAFVTLVSGLSFFLYRLLFFAKCLIIPFCWKLFQILSCSEFLSKQPIFLDAIFLLLIAIHTFKMFCTLNGSRRVLAYRSWLCGWGSETLSCTIPLTMHLTHSSAFVDLKWRFTSKEGLGKIEN